MITLQKIDEHNYWDAIKVGYGPGQDKFVAASAEILARAYAYRGHWATAWGIYADQELVGLALLEDLDDDPACYHLSEFLIDHSQQGKGYGQQALKLLLQLCCLERKYASVEVCVHKDAAAAMHVYEKLGFRDTGFSDENMPNNFCLSYSLTSSNDRIQHLRRIGLGEKALAAVSSLYRNRSEYLWTAAETSYLGTVPNFPICQLKPLERLAVWGLLLGRAAGNYAVRRIPDDVIWDTLQDVALRAALYEKKCGRPGLSKEDVIWLRHIYIGDIYKLGALQFQPFQMIYLDQEGCGESYMTFGKKPYLPGTSVLNVHIQYGADLTPQAVSDSFHQVIRFFPVYVPQAQPEAFVCYSWLLYPGLSQLLPPNSKILQFAAQFEIIGTAADSNEAVKRIYGRTKAEFPRNTALQRAALGRFRCLGEACGIREFVQNP